MQNIDFSQQARNCHRIPLAKGIPLSCNTNQTASQHSQRNSFTLLLAVAVLMFSFGTVFGIFIGHTNRIEKNLISKPDELRPEYNDTKITNDEVTAKASETTNKKKFTNAPSTIHSIGNYLIKVGVYPSTKAVHLAKQLNQNPELQKLRAHACKDIKRNQLLNEIAFHIPFPGTPEKENVFFGCFKDKEKALAALHQLLNLELLETKTAKLYEIEG